jgi:outer membrane receptor protein involved in Fe transport
VVDAQLEGAGVAEALVRIEGAEVSEITDTLGYFTLHAVPAGDVVLVVTAEDYETTSVAITAEQRKHVVSITVSFSAEDSLTITVEGTMPEPETASTTRVLPDDMRAAPLRNAEEILRQVPGITLVQHGSEGKGYQYFLRGFDATHGADLELTIDGVPLNEWSNIHAQAYLDLGVLLPEAVHEVAVTKGPFTLTQGAFAMAGSATFHLGVPLEALGWRAAYTVGTTNRHRLYFGYSPEEGTGQSFIGAAATYDDGFGTRRQFTRTILNGRAVLFDDVHTGTMTITGLGNYAVFQLPGTLRNADIDAGLVPFDGAYDQQAEGMSARGILSTDYQYDHDGHQVSVGAYGGFRQLELLENFTGFLLRPDDGDRREQYQRTWSFGLNAKHEWQALDALALLTGAGVRGDVFTQTENNVGQQLEQLAQRRDLSATQLIAHALAGIRWNPVRQLHIDVGARVDMHYVHTTDHLAADLENSEVLVVASPRATLRWKPNKAWGIFLAYGRGFRPPEARAFSTFTPTQTGLANDVYSGGSPEATVSDAVELGFRWEPGDWLALRLTGFATFIARETLFDHVSGVNLELNGTQRLGGELVVSTRPLPWLKLSADLTLVDARFMESGNQVPFAPWLVSGVRASVDHESGFRAGVRLLAVAPRPLPNDAIGATLLMLDMTLGYQWRWLQVSIELENLLNRELREGEYHYASHWRQGQTASQIPVLHTTAGPPLNARFTLGVQF